ncbi:MAG: hypothetical protein K2O56_00275 [Muribaculaceae bacterium]|nr:hypothetical protein [Muribaculaceae bacterium]
MRLKNLLLSFGALAVAPAFATTYYVTPEGAGIKDGLTRENAFGVEEFREQALKNVDGDVYELAAGTYKPSACIIFKRATYATLNGSTEGRTILSGDLNNDNYASSGDIKSLVRFLTVTGAGNSTQPGVINHIDFTCVYTNVDDDPTTDDSTNQTGVAGFGALYIDNSGDVTVKNCNFYGNWAQGQKGGPAAHCRRSTVKFINCVFRGNSANYRGGAVRLRTDNENKGITTFEGCVFKNNTNYHDFGGAIFMAQGNSLNIVNTTITGNKALSGAAIYSNRVNFPGALRIINSTIAGNTVTGDNADGQITSTQAANMSIVNSIIVSNDEKTSDIFFSNVTSKKDFFFTSGGYNYIGKVTDAQAEASKPVEWLDSDKTGADCSYASIFGENTVNSDNVIVPVKYFAGASGTQVETAVASWGLPEGLALAKDQNGKERTAAMMPGAYAITENEIPSLPTSVITAVEDTADAIRLVKTGNGIYTVKGATEGIAVYTVNGAAVAATSEDTIDISSFANGLYIIKSGNTVFKVIK